MSDFSFTIPGDEDDKDASRRAYRARVPGLEAWVPDMNKLYPVKDVSALGLALADPTKKFTEGTEFEFDLLLNKKLFLPKLKAKVMRVLDNGIIGCNFTNMDRQREARLDKLILEVQKRLIALRKGKGPSAEK